MSILNPSMNKMIVELAGMPPQQLAQYAAANQNDTMKFLAAKAASDMQKKQMAMGAAQQQQPAAPPVAQQVVQQMAQGLPEESGIGALPVPEMKHMAAGGIVAFADGGFNSELFRKFLESVGKTGSDFVNADPITKKGLLDAFGRATSGPQMSAPAPAPSVPAAPVGQSYAQLAESNPTMASRGLNALRAGIVNPMGLGVATTGGALSRAAAGNLSSRSSEELETLSGAGGGDDTALAAAILREGRDNPTPDVPAKPGDYRGSKAVPYTQESPAAFNPSAAALRGGASTQAGQAARADATKAGTGAAGAPGAARTGISALVAPQQMAAPDFVGSYADVLKQMPKSEVPKEFGEIEALRVAQATEGLTSEQEAAAKAQEVLGKRGARITEREKRLADKSANDINMSLIDAGLAMMQSRGQGLAGIAEGFTAGAKRYTEESRLTEAARQKVEEARDAYDDLKFNREDMSRKEINARKKEITDAHIAVKQANVDYMVKHEDMDRRTADRVYDAKMGFALEGQKQQYQARENALNRANALQAAGVSASAGTAAKIDMLEKLGAADPKSPLYRGYLMTVQEAQEPKMYADYQTKKFDPVQGEAFRKQYPTFELYKMDMSGGGNFVKPPVGAAAPIYTR